MPYKFQTEKLLVPKEHDKRIKLTPEQKELIRHLYETTDTSQRKLATKFGVSRRLITFILDPEKHKANLQAREDRGGSKQYYNKETHAKTMKSHRSHKKALYDASLLLAPDRGIIMQNKILEINKEEFLDWRFDDEEDLIFLGTFTFYKLNNNDTISIDTIWKATRYIPINLVKNQNEIDFEDEINPKDFDVKWI